MKGANGDWRHWKRRWVDSKRHNTRRKSATQSVNLAGDPSLQVYVGIYCKARDNVYDNLYAVCLAGEHINY